MKITTLNLTSFNEKVDDLSNRIDFVPDLVIGVPTGGKYVLKRLLRNKKFRSIDTIMLGMQRASTKIKQHSLINLVIKSLPYFIADFLRKWESKSVEKKIKYVDKREFFQIDQDLSKYSKILIIDDALDTGKTLNMIHESILKVNPTCEIRKAVISWTILKSIIQPDYYIFKNTLVRFPWSLDYKGKDKHEFAKSFAG